MTAWTAKLRREWIDRKSKHSLTFSPSPFQTSPSIVIAALDAWRNVTKKTTTTNKRVIFFAKKCAPGPHHSFVKRHIPHCLISQLFLGRRQVITCVKYDLCCVSIGGQTLSAVGCGHKKATMLRESCETLCFRGFFRLSALFFITVWLNIQTLDFKSQKLHPTIFFFFKIFTSKLFQIIFS